MNKPYFKIDEDAPGPLTDKTTQRIRFEEVDMLGIVWHGRYPSFFEDGRTRLGQKVGIGYMDFYSNHVIAPIKKLHVDYREPLTFDEEITIETILYWSDSVRLNHEYIITNSQGRVTTTGYTIQMMLDMNQNILMVPPPFYMALREKWKAGNLV